MRIPGATVAVLMAGAVTTFAQGFTFDDQKAGEPPRGWTCALTGGGRPGTWTVARDDSAPSPPMVLAQTDRDATSYRFPHCVVEGLSARDLALSVRFKPVSGQVDQAAGLVFRYRDPDNYYVVRANALEGNVVLYKVEKGRRSDLKPRGAGLLAYGKKVRVPSGAWSELQVAVKGRLFAVSLNGAALFEVEDGTFGEPGTAGVWTKADSVTSFDGFEVSEAR